MGCATPLPPLRCKCILLGYAILRSHQHLIHRKKHLVSTSILEHDILQFNVFNIGLDFTIDFFLFTRNQNISLSNVVLM